MTATELNMQPNETFRKIVELHPLIAVELYLHFQADACVQKGHEILAGLNNTIRRGSEERGIAIDATAPLSLHREFWFWVLGAYEFSRTLGELKRMRFDGTEHPVFDEAAREALAQTLSRLTLIRVPFAKLKRAGNRGRGAIDQDGFLSISKVTADPPDMFFLVPVGNAEQQFSMRNSITEFLSFVGTIERAIHASFVAAYGQA